MFARSLLPRPANRVNWESAFEFSQLILVNYRVERDIDARLDNSCRAFSKANKPATWKRVSFPRVERRYEAECIEGAASGELEAGKKFRT